MKSKLKNIKNKPLLFIAYVVLVVVSCKKDQQNGGLSSAISISPTSGLVGSLVTITGNGFSTDPSQDIVTFNGKKAEVLNVSSTQLIVVVPDSTTSGPVIVSVMGKQAQGPLFTFQGSIGITSINPQEAAAGASVTINGIGLVADSTKNSSVAGIIPKVFFNGQPAKLLSSSPTKLVVQVPQGAPSGPVSVSLSTLKATGPQFYYLGVNSISPLSGNAGTQITISGGFGPDLTKVAVTVNGNPGTIKSINTDQIVALVPTGSGSGPVVVSINGQPVTGGIFRYVAPPTISSFSPTSGPVGSTVTISGTGFSTINAENVVKFNGTAAIVSSESATQLTVNVPQGASNGPIAVNVNGQQVTGAIFKVQSLGIISVSPPSGPPGTLVTISGTGFNPSPSLNQVSFNGTLAVVKSATATQLVVTVPAGFTPGPLIITSGGLTATVPIFKNKTPGVTTIAGGTLNPNQFSSPVGLAIDGNGDIFVADNSLNNIQEIFPNGTVTTFATNLSGPTDLVFDKQGNLYVADGSAIRIINPTGVVNTFASMPSGDQAWGISIDASGNVYVTDQSSNAVDKFSSGGSFLGSTNYGPSSVYGVAVDVHGNVFTCYYGPGQVNMNSMPVIQNSSFGPRGISINSNGDVIVADYAVNQIYSPSSGNISSPTVITGGSGSGYQDGPLGSAMFSNPVGIKVDSQGNIYVADQGNRAIRKIVLP